MIKIYVKTTPISDWKYIGEVSNTEQANKVYTLASAKGYYCRLEAVE